MAVKVCRGVVAKVEEPLQCILGRHVLCDGHRLSRRCQIKLFSVTFMFFCRSIITKILVNKVEMVQRRAASFCQNDYKTIEMGCMSEMIGQLNFEPVNIRRTNRRLTTFPKAINGNLALPIGNLQSVLHRTRNLNSKTCNTIHTSKDSFFTRTRTDWNSLPDKIATIKEQQKFKLALTHFN